MVLSSIHFRNEAWILSVREASQKVKHIFVDDWSQFMLRTPIFSHLKLHRILSKWKKTVTAILCVAPLLQVCKPSFRDQTPDIVVIQRGFGSGEGKHGIFFGRKFWPSTRWYGTFSALFPGFGIHPNGGWPGDFWTINSINQVILLVTFFGMVKAWPELKGCWWHPTIGDERSLWINCQTWNRLVSLVPNL